MPEVTDGKLMAAMRPMIATTTISSMSVTPDCDRDLTYWLFQLKISAFDAISARLAVGAERTDIRFIAVVAGIFVDVGMRPRVVRNILRQVGTIPLRQTLRTNPQRIQSHFGCREGACVELVHSERCTELLHLAARRRHFGCVRASEEFRSDDRREQRDDRDHDKHFDERHTGLRTSSVSLFHSYTATSLMLVIASRILNINAPTIMPMMRITSGSKSEVNRRMATRVSFS